jgi:hypothetical protein
MCAKTKKAVKIILWSITIPVVVLALAFATSPLWLGSAVKSIANSIVPKKTGVGFEIKNMDLNIFSGKFLVEGTCLKNPDGYKPDDAVKVGKVFVHVDMSSLGSDVVHIKEITVNDVFASYVSSNGTNNFEWISNHAAANKDETEKAKDKPKSDAKDTKVIIDKLSVSNSKVQLEFIPLPLPDIQLTDIGKKSNGATLSDVGKQIWEYGQKSFSKAGNLAAGFLNSVGNELGNISDKASGSISSATNALNDVTKSVGDAAEKTTKAVSDAASGAVDAAGKGLNKATEAVSEGASKLFEKAGGLFGK